MPAKLGDHRSDTQLYFRILREVDGRNHRTARQRNAIANADDVHVRRRDEEHRSSRVLEHRFAGGAQNERRDGATSARSDHDERRVARDGFARDGIRYVARPNYYLHLVEIDLIWTKLKARGQHPLASIAAGVAIDVQNLKWRSDQPRER